MDPERVYMSRRREALDLARALALSTQEAFAAAELPPHTLSSKTTTQDSREMELKAVIDPRLDISFRDGRLGSDSGPSVINSFTPQLAVRPSSILASSSNSFPTPAQQLRSSPILPIPSSRLSTTDKTRSSGSSSHRPLFSPTQTSKDRPASGPTPQNRTPPRAMPGLERQKGGRRIVLSSSPPEAGPTGKHPSSDHEEQEEVEERPASRPAIQPKSIGRSRLAPRPFPMSPPPNRHVSPDPLEANLSGVISPSTVLVDESIMIIDPPQTRAHSSIPVESQISVAESASTRRSSRVVDNIAKKEREKEERRAKRRAEKEAKARKEAEAQRGEDEKAKRHSPVRKSMRLEVEVSQDDRRRSTRTAPESIIVLDNSSPRPRRDVVSAPHRPAASPAVNEPPPPKRPSKRAREINEDSVIPEAPAESGKIAPDQTAEAPGEAVMEAAPPTKAPAKKAKRDTKAGKKTSKKQREEQALVVAREQPTTNQCETRSGTGQINVVIGEVDAMDEVQAEPTNAGTKADGNDFVAEVEAEEEEEEVQLDQEEPVTVPIEPPVRSPLRTHASNVRSMPAESSSRASPGPSSSGIKWKTSRNDLNSVLSKFPGARQTGMSRKLKIAPLHMKIGPPVKALPPPPPKPSRKKKVDTDDEDDDDEAAELESDGEGGTRKKRKVKGIEWYMEED